MKYLILEGCQVLLIATGLSYSVMDYSCRLLIDLSVIGGN